MKKQLLVDMHGRGWRQDVELFSFGPGILDF